MRVESSFPPVRREGGEEVGRAILLCSSMRMLMLPGQARARAEYNRRAIFYIEMFSVGLKIFPFFVLRTSTRAIRKKI
jgi:hypothetical protein